MLTTAIVFILILGALVFVHELGHFLVSKKNGVPPEEFGFGFPPRIVGTYLDKKGKRKWVWGNKEIPKEVIDREVTLYSINWIPLGGFVKIKGEDGGNRNDPKSFASQSIWKRFKILVAGVIMNVLFGVFLFSVAFWIGLPEAVEDEAEVPNAVVQIVGIAKESPAEEAGLQPGDKVVFVESEEKRIELDKVEQLQAFIQSNKGKEVEFGVIHPGEDGITVASVNLRSEAPEGQGLSGVEIVRTSFVRHGIFKSIWLAIKTTLGMIAAIFIFLGDLIIRLFTSAPVEAEVAGPVGIAVLTGQMTRMGLAFILQFAAMLSINLAVINILPIPALDGGRILFLGIEKIKGKPLSEKTEGIIHAVGFFLLIGLMIFVTVRDFMNFNIFG